MHSPRSYQPALLGLLSLAIFAGSIRAAEPDFMESRYVAILSVYPKFAGAKEDAEKIASASGVPFSMEGRVYDQKRGLIYPDNFDDEVFRGAYVARRYDTTVRAGREDETVFLSVERSDGYEGFKPGFYIVVAGILENKAEAGARADRFRQWAPTAYVKKTRIYMGCMH